MWVVHVNVCTANTCTVDDELVSDLSSSHSYKTQKADFKTTNILSFFFSLVSPKAFCVCVYICWQSRMFSLIRQSILERWNVTSLTLTFKVGCHNLLIQNGGGVSLAQKGLSLARILTQIRVTFNKSLINVCFLLLVNECVICPLCACVCMCAYGHTSDKPCWE